MSKTNDLRAVIHGKLKTVCNDVYYENAIDDAMYPHCVFSFGNIVNDDFSRADITVSIDVWDKSESAAAVEDLCDDIERLFNNSNLPQENILPTFFLVNRIPVMDEDKKIRHRVIKLLVQNYER